MVQSPAKQNRGSINRGGGTEQSGTAGAANNESYEFLRKKDDLLRQKFYCEFMNKFNQNVMAQPGPSQVGSQRAGDMNIQDESV